MSITDATKAFSVKLDGHTFKPEFTYQLFEDESIFGYARPRIVLEFDDNYMPLITFKYGEKTDAGATNVTKLLKQEIEVAYTDRDAWKEADTTLDLNLGEPVATFDDYRLHKVELSEANKVLDRIKIFVKLFIDGGSYIDREDTAWEVYLLYKGTKLAGFCTVYPYFYYVDGSTFEKEGKLLRKRISQFLVFPPYQRQSVGTGFLASLYKTLYEDSRVRQITVEDPGEWFDVIRERISLELFKPTLAKLEAPLSEESVKAAALECKTDERTVSQLFEMLYLRQHGPTLDFKRLVKTRIYQQNLLEFESEAVEDKKEKLDAVYENVLDGYRTVLKLPKPEPTEEEIETPTPASVAEIVEELLPPRKKQHLE